MLRDHSGRPASVAASADPPRKSRVSTSEAAAVGTQPSLVSSFAPALSRRGSEITPAVAEEMVSDLGLVSKALQFPNSQVITRTLNDKQPATQKSRKAKEERHEHPQQGESRGNGDAIRMSRTRSVRSGYHKSRYTEYRRARSLVDTWDFCVSSGRQWLVWLCGLQT